MDAITPVVNNPFQTPTSGAGTAPNSRLDRDSFLKLLVAQLKFQNPAEPMDPTNLLGQTAQLTMVDKLNELVALQQSNASMNNATVAAGLIGRDVTWSGGTGTVDAVRLIDGTMEIVVAGMSVPLDEIVEVRANTRPVTSDVTGPTTDTPSDVDVAASDNPGEFDTAADDPIGL